MIGITSSGFGLLDRLAASQSARLASADRSTSTARPTRAAESSTQVTFGAGSPATGSAVYIDPRTTPGVTRLWSAPVGKDDTVSALMARNRGVASYDYDDQWRGLGGALLARFAKTGEDYTQTLVDDVDLGGSAIGSTPDEQAEQTAALRASQAADLAGITTGATTAGLMIRTRSGQSVLLTISVNQHPDGAAIAGMKVELKASGTLSATERAAIGRLADGLDHALDGIGRPDAVGLDLSGLTGYDRRAIASIDLTAKNSSGYQPLGSFALHLGDDERTVALSGSDGKLDLDVDQDTPLVDSTSSQQRSAAIQRILDRMDSAGERGHATAALVAQMQSAFTQLETAATPSDGDSKDASHPKADTPSVPTAHARVDAAVASQLSGLADFDARFAGDTHRSNRDGSVHEAGHAEDRLSQTTTTKETAHGGRAAAQTVSERLSASFRDAPHPDGRLDVDDGSYTATRISDSSTATTLVESDPRQRTSVLRETDAQQLETVTDVVNHRAVHTRSWPSQHSLLQRWG